ncbi:uncharacterized protein HKW66_Vig0190230 [Vigna angularis]|uniref:Uncharacterized protein n=1 Tax=Phaseolus angularis TaxID=3914 RepID=A0A8T0KP79_PHAAN|nr:uncharacterized protein HKW66_Vig0190230 [Vigna angularis]
MRPQEKLQKRPWRRFEVLMSKGPRRRWIEKWPRLQTQKRQKHRESYSYNWIEFELKSIGSGCGMPEHIPSIP